MVKLSVTASLPCPTNPIMLLYSPSHFLVSRVRPAWKRALRLNPAFTMYPGRMGAGNGGGGWGSKTNDCIVNVCVEKVYGDHMGVICETNVPNRGVGYA